MKRKIMILPALVLLLYSLSGYIYDVEALAAQKNGMLITLTQPEQVLDIIDYQGAMIEAIYTNGAHSGSDPIYSCAAFIKKFYLQSYNINVYNLHSTISTPLIYDDKGSFRITELPQVGDIVRDNNRTHWAIVKEVSEDTITLIQQNYRTGTTAWVGCTVDRKDPGYTFFTYSERIADDPVLLVPQVIEGKKTLYTGYQDVPILLEGLAEDALLYFYSDMPEVAVVSTDGVVSPVQKGGAIIYINVIQNNMNYLLLVEITVKEPYLKLSSTFKELNVGNSMIIKLKQYGNRDEISWQVSNEEIATIDEKTGKLYARKQGVVTVTANTAAGLKAKLKIKVI